MSFNIRYDNPNDGVNDWPSRKNAVINLIKKYKPELIGIQEALHHQKVYMDNRLEDYICLGKARDDGDTLGEYTCLMIDTSVFKIIRDSTFWLSKTPNKPSKSWDAALNRICTYAAIENKENGNLIHILNTHFDHRGVKSRNAASELLVHFARTHIQGDAPTIIMGDLNAKPESKCILTLKKYFDDPLDSRSLNSSIVGTYNAFDFNYIPQDRIDYILSKNLNVIDYRHILLRRTESLFVSDHFPVLMEFKIE